MIFSAILSPTHSSVYFLEQKIVFIITRLKRISPSVLLSISTRNMSHSYLNSRSRFTSSVISHTIASNFDICSFEQDDCASWLNFPIE